MRTFENKTKLTSLIDKIKYIETMKSIIFIFFFETSISILIDLQKED